MEGLLLISALISWGVILCQAAALLTLGRAQAELAQQVEELEITASARGNLRGEQAPPFRLKTADGRRQIGLEDLRGHRVLVIFLSPSCPHCRQFLARTSALVPALRSRGIELLGISSGDAAAIQRQCEELAVAFPILVEEQWQVSRRYHIGGTPWGVALDRAGLILASGPVGTQEQCEGLLQTLESSRQMPAERTALSDAERFPIGEGR